MGKSAGKRSSTSAPPPAPLPPKKVDPGLQSLMDYGDNLEEFVAICAHLPYELKEDLQRVASLNESTHPLTYELSRDQTEILERAKAKYRAMKRPEQLEGLVDEEALQRAQEKRRKVEQCVSEKVSITKRMYDALDSCIKNIDEEIDKLERDVKESYGVIPDFALLAPEVAAEAKRNEMEIAAAAAAAGGAASGAQATAGPAASAGMGALAGAAGGGVGSGADGTARRDENISANEPVYCVCRQVGWGDMIGCDNEDCEHGEWFHYHCVGLEEVDQKQLSFWLCPGCAADAREKERLDQLELIRRANANSAAVKLAAVKLPDDREAEGEDDDGDDAEEDPEEVAAGGEDDKEADQENPGSERSVDAHAETPKTVANHDLSTDTSSGGGERLGEAIAGGQGGVDRVPSGSEVKADDGALKPDEHSGGAAGAWSGLGGLGSNALPEGSGMSGEGPQGLDVATTPFVAAGRDDDAVISEQGILIGASVVAAPAAPIGIVSAVSGVPIGGDVGQVKAAPDVEIARAPGGANSAGAETIDGAVPAEGGVLPPSGDKV